MFSSLDKIDIVMGPPGGGAPLGYVQTDHRTGEEIAATPEVSALFALARVVNAQTHAAAEGNDVPVIYATQHDDLPACVRDVLAATGAQHQVGTRMAPRSYARTAVTAGELADRAFQGLAGRVSRRVGLTDMATVLRALEAETLVDPPRQDDDEAAYWTRVFELAAVTCEVVRARGGGRWEIQHHADVPFGFATSTLAAPTPAGSPGAGGIILATNRAHRFIADGKEESMFLLLSSDIEESVAGMQADDLPVMPNLRPRREAVTAELAWQPLFRDAPDDDDFPVVVYGHDTPETFGAFRAGRAGDLNVAHTRALANLRGQDVSTDAIEVEGVSLIAVSGSYYAAEKLLDREFMRGLHRRLDHDILAVSVPRRGLMFATAVHRSDKRELLVLQAATRHEAKTTRTISEAILLVKDGAVAGHVVIDPAPRAGAIDGSDDDDEAPPAKPPRKPSWFARLFGKKK